MSRLRISAPGLSWVAELRLVLLPSRVLGRALDGEPPDLATPLAGWAAAAAVTVMPYGLSGLAIRGSVRR